MMWVTSNKAAVQGVSWRWLATNEPVVTVVVPHYDILYSAFKAFLWQCHSNLNMYSNNDEGNNCNVGRSAMKTQWKVWQFHNACRVVTLMNWSPWRHNIAQIQLCCLIISLPLLHVHSRHRLLSLTLLRCCWWPCGLVVSKQYCGCRFSIFASKDCQNCERNLCLIEIEVQVVSVQHDHE